MSLVRLEELTPGIALLTLDDPERLNAMGEEMARDFRARILELKQAPPRAVVITGEGRAFSAGGDLAMLENKRHLSFEENRMRMLDFYRSFLDILRLEVPIIAAVNGVAVGAGFCLASACDLRIADPGARLSVPFLKLGLFPGMGASYFFNTLIGPRSHELLLTGRTLNAQEAMDLGLLTRLSAEGKVLEETRKLTEELLKGAPLASRDLLIALRGPIEPLQLALQKEAEWQARCYARPEFAERLAQARARVKS